MERTLRLLPAKYHRNQKTNQYIMQKCEDPAQPWEPEKKQLANREGLTGYSHNSTILSKTYLYNII